MTDRLVFHVEGSKGVIYQLSFQRSGNNLTAHCTCKAGKMAQYCKHRFALLCGDVTALKSSNHAEVDLLYGWLRGSDVEMAMKATEDAEEYIKKLRKEEDIAIAKIRLKELKKNIARAMTD